MPNPTISTVQPVDPILTNMLIGYQQADDRFVAGRVFPYVPVEKLSGQYFIATKKYFFFDDLLARAPGAGFGNLPINYTTATYRTIQYAGAFIIPDEIRADSQVPLDLETVQLKQFSQKSLIRKEVGFSTDFMVGSVWGTTDNNSATDWDDFAASDPVDNILTATRTISNNTGINPNTMVLGYIVHQALVNHPDIIDRLKYTEKATMASIMQALASIFGKDNYFVGMGSYTNTNEAATFSATAIIDDDCLVCHVDPGAGLFGATAGKTFFWEPGGGQGKIYRDLPRFNHGDWFQQKEQWDQVATATDLGYIFLDIV